MNLIFAPALNPIAQDVHRLAKEKGWHPDEKWEDYAPKAIANLHGEVAEFWEAFRAGKLGQPCDKADEMQAAGLMPLSCSEEELADIIIRALDASARLGIDISRAVDIKHAFNATRPHRHGGKLA